VTFLSPQVFVLANIIIDLSGLGNLKVAKKYEGILPQVVVSVHAA
jgi:hypothetical protein